MPRLLALDDTVAEPAMFTPWSLAHFMTGVLVAMWAARLLPDQTELARVMLWNSLHMLYEAKDLLAGTRCNPEKGSGYWIDNSTLNSAVDHLVALAGYALGYWARNRIPIAPVTGIYAITLLICKGLRLG